jgi:hypothetical protein
MAKHRVGRKVVIGKLDSHLKKTGVRMICDSSEFVKNNPNYGKIDTIIGPT